MRKVAWPNIVEENSETERPKFGISSLISRMSRSETVSSGSGISRKEPNFNSDITEEHETDDLEQEKIEVPAFLRGRLTNFFYIVYQGLVHRALRARFFHVM